MPDISATLAAIDAVVGCHQCGGGLGESPSDDFCSEECDRTWRAGRVGVRTDGWGEPILTDSEAVEAHWEHLHHVALFGGGYLVSPGTGAYPELRPVPMPVPMDSIPGPEWTEIGWTDEPHHRPRPLSAEDLPPLYRITARGDVSWEREDPAFAGLQHLRGTFRRWFGA